MQICRSLYGMVWYGMVWYGMVWYGMVWFDWCSFRENILRNEHDVDRN
jgi:hypothetical protein